MTNTLPYQLLCGDCLDVLPTIEAGSVRLIFADPPYNQGVNYGNGKAADRLPRDEYRSWVGRWVSACADALAADGSLGTSTMGPGVGWVLEVVGVSRRRN